MCTLIGREVCLHESMQTWLWRHQDVFLFACWSHKHKFEQFLSRLVVCCGVYFIYPWFPHWLKLGKALQTSCVKQSIFHLSWHFKEEKSVFWKAFFLQNKNFMLASLHVHDFTTGNNFSCISTMTCQQFCVFSW